MLQLQVPSIRRLSSTRQRVREALSHTGLSDADITVVETVVGELLGAAYESHVAPPIEVTVEQFARLTSVRVRCSQTVDLRDDPFDLRERVLQGLTLAFGTRRNANNTIDLWAEVPRSQ